MSSTGTFKLGEEDAVACNTDSEGEGNGWVALEPLATASDSPAIGVRTNACEEESMAVDAGCAASDEDDDH